MKDTVDSSFRSAKTTDALIVLIKTLIVLITLSAIFSAFELLTPDIYKSLFFVVDGIVALIVFIAIVVTVVVAIRWIYLIHQDLNKKVKEYPLKPSQAVLRFAVPLYNIWGVQDVLLKMHERFKYGTGKLGVFGFDLKKLTTAVYITWILSVVVTRLTISSMDAEGNAPAYFYLLSAVVDLAFYFTALQVVLVVKNNLLKAE